MEVDASPRAPYAERMPRSLLLLRAPLLTFACAIPLFATACATTSEISGNGGTAATTTGGAGGGGSTTTTGAGGTTTTGAGGTTTTTTAPLTCEGKTGPLDDNNLKIMSGGVLRDADVHIPPGYDPTVPTTLILDFHGYTWNAYQQSLLDNMKSAGDERGYIVVYPNGLNLSWNAGDCCGTSAAAEVNDVGYVSALIDKLSELYCIDPARVFATGMSNGAFLAHRLGCELSSKIAAIAPVAGDIGIPLENCQPPRKVSVMDFHGTLDLVVPYAGGTIDNFPSVDASMARWRAIDACGDATDVTYDKGDSQCVTWKGCADTTEVTLCKVTGGGHTWPGGTPVPALGWTTTDLDATNAMLDFFEKHPMN